MEEQHHMHGNLYNYNFSTEEIHQRYRAPEAQKNVHFVESNRRTEVIEKKFHNEYYRFIKTNNNSNM